MKEKIDELMREIEAFTADKAEDVEQFRIKYLSRKGEIPSLFDAFKSVAPEERKILGQAINTLKTKAQEKHTFLKARITEQASDAPSLDIDLTRPAVFQELGARHPLSIVRRQILDIFARIGYTVAEGPEIEDDWHNFSALNFPEEHPARDMQDTFFIRDEDAGKNNLLEQQTAYQDCSSRPRFS